jgi:hypothetical protein
MHELHAPPITFPFSGCQLHARIRQQQQKRKKQIDMERDYSISSVGDGAVGKTSACCSGGQGSIPGQTYDRYSSK